MTRYSGPEALCWLLLQATTQVLYVTYSLAIGFVLSLKFQGISPLCLFVLLTCQAQLGQSLEG